jgi:hypothetical protein
MKPQRWYHIFDSSQLAATVDPRYATVVLPAGLGPGKLIALMSQEAHMTAFSHQTMHFSLDVLHAKTESKRIIRRLAILFVVTVVAATVCALAIYLLERRAHDSDIKSYGLALFWSASQLLTLGSSLGDPVTTTGRVITVGMDVYAVVVIGTVSGTLGAYFLHRINERLQAAEETLQSQPPDSPRED